MADHTVITHHSGMVFGLPGGDTRRTRAATAERLRAALGLGTADSAELCALTFTVQLLDSPIFAGEGPARELLCQMIRLSSALLRK